MRSMWHVALGLAVMAGTVDSLRAATVESATIGTKSPEFTLKDFRGKTVSLSDFKDKKLIVLAFLGVECPLAKQYAPRLTEIGKKYESRGLQIIGIDANQQDSVTEMNHYARIHGVEFPLLKDVGNSVADGLKAERTPEVYLLDQDRIVRYRGRIDDQYGFKTGGGYAQTKVRTTDLTNAIEDLLADRPVSVTTTHADGCRIGRVRQPNEKSEVTYTKQISRIFQKHCENCHRPGEIGPFALQSYDEAAGWAEMIDEVVRDQRMPPWHASPDYGHWANDSRLSDEEKRIIHEWVEAGAPKGDPKDLPEPKKFVDGWQIGVPDQIIYMRDEPFKVAAEGTIDYQYFTVDPGFKEDKWIRAVECRPGNRSVVHHIIVFVQPPGVQAQMFEGGPANLSLLQGEAPGMPATMLPDGTAFFVPAGSKLLFQMHYTANGSPQEDRSCVGLCFTQAGKVKEEARTMNAGNPFFEIPARANNFPVDASFRFFADTKLLSLMPHMHVRGKAFKYTLEYPDGKSEVLLDVPRYDFNWQNTYEFAEPKIAPAGSVLKCVAHYDNSSENLANPDPNVAVRWGEQTWEEMMLGWFVCTMDMNSASDGARTKTFNMMAEKGEIKPSLEANIAILGAFKSDRDFRRFARTMAMYVPQLDRVCVSTLEGDKLVFLQVSQPPIWNSKIGSTEFRVPREQSTLAWILTDDKPVMNGALAAVQGEDFGRLSLIMKSSFHVPAKIQGKQVLVSFWSRDENGFPEKAQEFLKKVAAQATKNAKLPSPAPSPAGSTVSTK